MTVEPSTSSSRRDFILQASNVASALGLTVLGTCAVPDAGMAKDFAGFDIRGIETAEVLHPGIGGGGWTSKATKPLRDCVVNVERVRVSTKQLEDDLTNKGAPPGLAGLVKGLVKNYRLDESLTQGALYIESSKDRAAAASAGKEALEYLAQTVEYFPPEVDQRTGLVKTTLSAEALEFTVNALVATQEKLDVFLSKIPSEAVQEARAELAAEQKGM